MFVLIFLTLLAIFYFLLKRKYEYWKKKGVPHPQPTFLLGNIARALFLTETMDKICHEMYNKYKEDRYVGFFNLWHPALVIRDPELVKDVLIKQFASFNHNWIETETNIDPSLGYNPFVLRSQWKTIRAQLTPQFTSAKIKSMFPGIQKGCNNLVDYIRDQTESKGSNTLECVDLLARYTGDNVIGCAYGLEGKSFSVKVPDSFKVGDQIASSSKLLHAKQTVALFLPWLRKLFKVTFIGDPVPKMFTDLIVEAMKYRDQNHIVRNDFLDFMRELKVKSPQETPDEVLVAHAFTFFLDGFETSSLAFSYALYELSLNPDVQNAARKEAEAVLAKYKGEISYEAVQEMEYIDNVVSETLRKHPIIKFISRVCTEDHEVPAPEYSDNSGRTVSIEKGTHIFLPVTAIHNDPALYPNPEEFNPDRFREQSSKGCFLGFGDGPRICLGRRFGIAQLKSGLASILANYEVRFNGKTASPLGMQQLHVFNLPQGGIWLDFHKRC